MKKAKFATAAVLMLVVLVLTGEVYTWHLSSFAYSGYASMRMYLNEDKTHEEMLRDIEETAYDCNVEIFTIDRVIESLLIEKLYIYATDGAEAELQETSQIREGEFESVFIGAVEVAILPLSQAPPIAELASDNSIYVIGTQEDILRFRVATIEAYAGNHPNYFPNGRDGERINVAFLWVVAVVLILLLTQFEIDLMKKETLIRLINGERIQRIVLKNILLDAAVFLAIAAFLVPILGVFTNTYYAINIAQTAIGALVVLNSASYLRLPATDYKRDITSHIGAKNTIRAAYVFQVVTAVLTVAILAGNVDLITGSIAFYRQRDFFEQHDGVSYLSIPVYTQDFLTSEQVAEDNYGLAVADDAAIMLAWVDGWYEDAGYIFANRGAVPYLKEQIPELRDITLDEKVYFIVPHARDNDARIDDMTQVWEAYYSEEYESEIVTYSRSAQVVAIIQQSSKLSSNLTRSPAIVLNNMGAEHVRGYNGIGYLYQSVMFDLSREEVTQYHDKLGYKDVAPMMTNALENYRYQWQFEKKTLLIAVVLLVLVFFLESLVIRTILKFEYRVNATELALKKVLGHTVLSRHRRILLTNVITGGAGLIAAAALCLCLKPASLFSIVVCGAFLMIIECMFIIWNARQLESRNIQRILKGESL